MTKDRRVPSHSVDSDGRKITLVPLANWRAPAKLFQEDFERLALAVSGLPLSHLWQAQSSLSITDRPA